MVSDLTYELESLEAGDLPGVGEQGAMRTSSAMVRDLAAIHPDLVILPAHDPGAAARLARANGGNAQR